MKNLRFFAGCAAVMLLLPAGISLCGQSAPAPSSEPAPAADLNGMYRILQTATGEVTDVPLRDYLIGAVGAEMPASYEPEALKAQVIACHTYAERIRQLNAASPDPALCGADLSDDSSRYQAFFTKDALQAFWGDSFPVHYAALSAAVDAVGDLLLYYDDEPIVAAFHAISAGETESAAQIWGTDLPYLVSVDSASDRKAPQFEETVVLPPDTVRKALLNADPECILPENPAEWFADAQYSDAGTLLQIRTGSLTLSGQQLRDILALRSACISAAYTGDAFRFTTKGFGHGVGMSQFGANEMAKSGSSYAEILAHYYPGTTLAAMDG